MSDESSSGVEKPHEEVGASRDCEADARRIVIGMGVATSSVGVTSGGGDFTSAIEFKKGSESSSCKVERSFGSNLSIRRMKLLNGIASSSSMLYFSVSTLSSAVTIIS